MLLNSLWQVVASALLVTAATPTKTVTKRATGASDAAHPFVTVKDGQFIVNGSTLNFVGTNAYWLAALNSDDDIDFTLGNMSAKGIRVVRTWAFNDVETIPENGTWFQLIANGTTTVNEGPNGLQKLDTVVRLAEKHGILLHLSLTNNWNPRPLLENNVTGIIIEGRDVTNGTGNNLPRNTLSNDYGGMDVYVRQFGSGNLSSHDEFYTNPVIISKFLNYTTQIVSRYANNTSVFAWEIANDPRCNSSMKASPNCNTMTVTRFHQNVTDHIKSIDKNHLVASGNQGFFCTNCTKIFPRVVVPPPQTSPRPGRRSNMVKPLTTRKLFDDRKLAFKKSRALRQKTNPPTGGIRIRGRWMSTETRRQSFDMQNMGPAFDGSQGVDSEDIINIPGLDFGTFQLFPDQNSYGPDDPNLPAFNNTVNQGLAWIQLHASLGKLFNKPIILNGFGLVTQNNSQSFVPFNSSLAPFGADTGLSSQAPFGVTDQQRDDAYTQWLQAGLEGGLQGMLQYQWSQGNLTTQVGTAISPPVAGTGVSPDIAGTGVSPDDGYAIQGQAFDNVTGIIQSFSQDFGRDDSSS
ncbi:glycoside hydrolase family 5 protein [Agrocybe pediades]|nr:glycoside hydrolase family 5 protein [Agrocybe pediades]